MNAYRAMGALVAWSGLLLQYYLMARGSGGEAGGGTLARRTTNYFSDFTILANLMTATMFTSTTIASTSRTGLFFAKPAIRTEVTLYMCATAATYVAILQAFGTRRDSSGSPTPPCTM